MLIKNPGLRSTLIKKAITITPQTGILDAIEVIQKYRIGRLVVIDRTRKPIGIITEKDMLKALYPLDSKPIGSIRVGDLMSKNLITVTKKDSVYRCAKIMKDNNISSVIVLHDDGNLDGILTKTDLVFNFLNQESTPLKISKIMTTKVVTVSQKDSLFLVESMLINNKISRVVVVQNQKPIGIITYRDFIPARIPNRLGTYTDPNELRDMWYNPHPNQFNINQLSYVLTFKAEDIMTKNPVTIEDSDDVSMAALVMYRYGISGIPVVKQSKLVGIVTKSDIVFALAEEA
ncbi:CBS domain-containing protein [Candidatus Nitrosotenuis chungbukensis]|uniref:CBS domain-containing protein n=1 Tax=Candidatus Nitrosotenuis chungbukensis TaxID=1353246 RepID=UPI0005B2BA49|nr:CBS domain-containing protein [Candidatus Nitrosotenuis chungbukensis]